MPAFALVIAQHSAHLYRLARRGALLVATAGIDDAPARWVAQHLPANANCSMVSDLMDESYIRSVLPPIWLPSTRRLLLRRRLQLQHRTTRYSAAVLVPSGSWRPPTRASLFGMGQTERIDEWLAALVARQVRIRGLWPLSELIALAVDQHAVRRARPEASTTREPASTRPILALVSTAAGLRQVLVRGKTPLFSRLASSGTEGSLSSAYVLIEARRTVQYLISQEWLTSSDQPVATQVWLPVDDSQSLVQLGSDLALDVQSIEGVSDAYSRLLPFLKLASAQTQCLPANYTTSWRAAQIAGFAQMAGVTALVVSAAWSAESLWESYSKGRLGQEQVRRAAILNKQASQEVQRAKGDISQAGLAVATVQVWQQMIAAQPSQLAAMQHLANSMRTAPKIEIQNIRWELPAVVTAAVGAPFECPGGSPRPPADALLKAVMTLPEDLNQRQALQLEENLLTTLNARGWTAYVSRSSVDLDPSQAQTGKLGVSMARTLALCVQKVPP